MNADYGPSFRNTLSAGDRNTLALAFFFASLELGANLENKIVVIDDSMTSLDEHRTVCTRAEIMAFSERVQQVIVLSHSRPFLCNLWKQAGRNAVAALRIIRSDVGSQIAVWDVYNDIITEHDRRHELVRRYMQAADLDKKREVAQALRPILEAFLRVAYPEHFPPRKLIGRFLQCCDRQVGTDDEILAQAEINQLRELNDYAKLFHHHNNQAGQTKINEAELICFAKQTLSFASR